MSATEKLAKREGLVLRDAQLESWEDHLEAWHHAGRIADGAAWERARIAASLEGKHGEDSIGTFAREVGFSPASVYDFAKTYTTFPEVSDRSENLYFSHYLHAVHWTTSKTEAWAAVALAEKEGWSANALRAYLAAQKALPSAKDFHILIASGEFRDALATWVHKRAEKWPTESRPHLAELLRALASELEEEFRAA